MPLDSRSRVQRFGLLVALLLAAGLPTDVQAQITFRAATSAAISSGTALTVATPAGVAGTEAYRRSKTSTGQNAKHHIAGRAHDSGTDIRFS